MKQYIIKTTDGKYLIGGSGLRLTEDKTLATKWMESAADIIIKRVEGASKEEI